MSIMRFNDFREFDEELGAVQVKDNTVRVTLSLRYDAAGLGFITLVCRFETPAGAIVECVEYQGAQSTDPTSWRAKEIQMLLDARKAALTARGYTVRPGRFHVAPGKTR